MAVKNSFCSNEDVFNNVEDWSDNKQSGLTLQGVLRTVLPRGQVHLEQLYEQLFSNLAPTTPMMKAGRTEPCKPTTGINRRTALQLLHHQKQQPRHLEVSQIRASYQGRYQRLGYHRIRGRLTIQPNLAR